MYVYIFTHIYKEKNYSFPTETPEGFFLFFGFIFIKENLLVQLSSILFSRKIRELGKNEITGINRIVRDGFVDEGYSKNLFFLQYFAKSSA